MLDRSLSEGILESANSYISSRYPNGEVMLFQPQKPAKIPEKIWNNLTSQQRTMQWMRSWTAKILSGEIDLSTEEKIKLLYEEDNVSSEEAKKIAGLWELTIDNAKNPTWDQVYNYVLAKMRRKEPIKMALSQCIEKTPDIRRGKIEYFCKSKKFSPLSFIGGLEKKGWQEIKELINAIDYPMDISIYIGDMDFLTLDGCQYWCDSNSLNLLESELKILEQEVRSDADQFFGKDVVQIKRWSNEYDVQAYKDEEVRAENNANWRSDAFMKTSRYPYIKRWGYTDLADSMDISPEKLQDFIDRDIIRTAAQYRVESNVMIKNDCIQSWAETVGSPLWPIQISNYDNNGSPPSLLLI